MVDQVPNGSGKKARERSPSYPGIDLEDALKRAATLREKEGRIWIPFSLAFKHWGLSPKSSAGFVELAALIKFGLLVSQGAGDNRTIKLSDLALAILLDDRPNSPERTRHIREAALMPAIHRELWAEFGGQLPTDDNLRFRLRNARAFTDSAAGTFVEEFKRTISFARLIDDATLSGSETDKPSQGSTPMVSAAPGATTDRPGPSKPATGSSDLSTDSNVRVLRWGLPGDRQAEIRVTGGPLTKKDIEVLRQYLAVAEMTVDDGSA